MNALALAAPIFGCGTHDLTMAVQSALRAEFRDFNAAVKRICEIANCNEKTARNWWEGRNCPNALQLLKLLAGVPAFQAEIRRLTAMHAELDPEFERDMHRMVTTFNRIAAERAPNLPAMLAAAQAKGET